MDGPDSEAEKDQHPENKPGWSVPSPDWRAWWQRSLALPRAQGGDQDYKYDGTSDDSNFLSPPGGWDQSHEAHCTRGSSAHLSVPLNLLGSRAASCDSRSPRMNTVQPVRVRRLTKESLPGSPGKSLPPAPR